MQHVKEANHNIKSFVNPVSKQIVETKRPNMKVEDILTIKGEEAKTKIQKMEKEIYNVEKVPQITKKAQLLQREQNVYSR